MRIGFDAKRAFNNTRGLGNYSRDTIRILAAQNPENQYVLFTPSKRDDILFTVPDNSSVIEPEAFFDRSFPSFWRTFSLAKLAEKSNLDIYHGLSHELPRGIEKTRLKRVVTMHDLIFLKFPNLYPFIDRKLYEKKYLHSCEIANHIIAISEQTKRDLIELARVPEDKITVVYQGCNPVFNHEVTAEQKAQVREKYHLPAQFILNVGALEKRKNQLLILQSMALKNIDFQMVIVGVNTKYADVLRQFIASHGLEKRVMILSDVPFTDLPAIYQSASLFVYPSLFEGFGIPILEAMHSGVPVIAATGSCLEESGGPGSLYVSPDNAEELADKISKVLSDSSLRAEMLQKSAEYMRLFSDEAIARNLMSIYRKVLA